MTEPVFLSNEDMTGLVTPAEYVEAVRDGYRQRGEGGDAAPREKLFRRDPGGLLTSYTAILPDDGVMGGYTYSAGFGASDAWFVTPLFDADSGEPLAILDGAHMNPFKTGAAGAVAADELARDDAETLAVIGSGPQARGQLYTTATVRPFTEVRIYSPTTEHREAFATEADAELDGDVRPVGSAPAAVSGADVVITATTASEPVFDGGDLDPGAHVTAMGQYHPKKREIDVETVEGSTYVPDLRERVSQDAGAFLAAMDAGAVTEAHVHAELGDVVAGERPGRTDEAEITVFDSGGTGIETVAGANVLYERAREAGLGQPTSFAPASEALTGKLE